MFWSGARVLAILQAACTDTVRRICFRSQAEPLQTPVQHTHDFNAFIAQHVRTKAAALADQAANIPATRPKTLTKAMANDVLSAATART